MTIASPERHMTISRHYHFGRQVASENRKKGDEERKEKERRTQERSAKETLRREHRQELRTRLALGSPDHAVLAYSPSLLAEAISRAHSYLGSPGDVILVICCISEPKRNSSRTGRPSGKVGDLVASRLEARARRCSYQM